MNPAAIGAAHRWNRRGMLAGLALLCAACGGGSTPSTGARATVTAQTTSGSARATVAGEVAAVHGDTVIVTRRDGTDADLLLGPDTAVSTQNAADIAEATVGSCALAIGTRTAADLVVARQVVLGARHPDGGCRQGAGGAVGRVGAAGGRITAVDGSTYTVEALGAPQRFEVTLQTRVSRVVPSTASSITPGVCVQAFGHGDGAGRVVARSVTLFTAPTGGCVFNSGG